LKIALFCEQAKKLILPGITAKLDSNKFKGWLDLSPCQSDCCHTRKDFKNFYPTSAMYVMLRQQRQSFDFSPSSNIAFNAIKNS